MHVNKKNLDKELRQKAWAGFLRKIKAVGSSQEIVDSLGSFLTSDEIIALEKRLIIPLLINKNLSYRKIGEMIDVSPVTISFVKNKLKRKPVVHRKHSTDKTQKKRTGDEIPYLMSPTEHMRRLRRGRIGLG